ncbi:M28 family peptidase [Phenylobacterium sp.]|uniref:M28 family metallopeptidase n=1 Tax=Phenylobacterium sp. TaxID=1871053 RepID=UPI00121295FF|nr:M28 family peptidase [Phenylobacterium sp.]THD58395.1 MAG: M28 family peptidase [Phenylobacterium sp.]
MKVQVLFAAALTSAAAFAAPLPLEAARPAVCAECVKTNMQRLAGDELRGRGCGTEDEHAAAHFVADTLKRYGAAPGIGPDNYLMPVRLSTPTAASPPSLEFVSGATHVTLAQGRDMAAMEPPPSLQAPFIRLTDAKAATDAVKGKLVVYDSPIYDASGMQALLKAGAVAVVVPVSDEIRGHWDDISTRPPGRTQIDGIERGVRNSGVVIFAKADAMAALRKLPEGEATLSAPQGPPRERTTYAVLGVLRGAAPDADHHAILLSAHYDHLGVRGGVIYHGANDDASGTAAVLEFARILGQGGKPKRAVYFALWGCEEEGGLAARAFLAHPPMMTNDISANIEFEMIGVDDPKHPGFMMMTGWERSNLGPTLAAHGAKIVADPYPEQNFFQRSDNYALAQKGVVAQTVSAWPIPPTYHDPSDDLAHVDLNLMDRVIGSMVAPVTWLANSSFTPSWNPGQKP